VFERTCGVRFVFQFPTSRRAIEHVSFVPERTLAKIARSRRRASAAGIPMRVVKIEMATKTAMRKRQPLTRGQK